MYLVAGTGPAGSTGDGGAATSAQINAPRGVWADAVGNVYIADTSNNKIRVVDIPAISTPLPVPEPQASNGDGGPATAAAISNPQGVMTDANLNVYIADSAKVRVVCVTCGTGSPLDALLAKVGISAPQNGYIYTIAGGAASSYSGAYPTLATNVTMAPQKLAIDGSSNLYISDGNGAAWFLDGRTANIRPIAGKQTTNCSSETDNFGDGCPATQAVIGDGGNGIGVGTDTLGNIYISDTMNARIRKVTTDLASPSTSTGITYSKPLQLHFIAGDAAAASNAFASSSPEWSLGSPSCTTNSDTTTDCLLTAGFTPAVPGARSTPLTVNSAAGNTANLALTGTGLGAGSTLDPASKLSFGTNLKVAGLATDTAGNVYVSDANSKQILRFAPAALAQGTSAASTSLATLGAPGAVAVDPRGYVYAADTSTGLITQISPSGAASTLSLALTTPVGLAVDALNNLYIADSSTTSVYQLNPITGVYRTLATGTLVAPAGLAIDPSGNLLITDSGAPAIYRFNLQSGVTTTVSSAAVKPSAIATDAAGNLLIADMASILGVPASANSAAFTVASLAPSALAIDSAGDLYTGSGGAVFKLIRTQGTAQFAGALALPQTFNLLESGNQALQLELDQPERCGRLQPHRNCFHGLRAQRYPALDTGCRRRLLTQRELHTNNFCYNHGHRNLQRQPCQRGALDTVLGAACAYRAVGTARVNHRSQPLLAGIARLRSDCYRQRYCLRFIADSCGHRGVHGGWRHNQHQRYCRRGNHYADRPERWNTHCFRRLHQQQRIRAIYNIDRNPDRHASLADDHLPVCSFVRDHGCSCDFPAHRFGKFESAGNGDLADAFGLHGL